MSLDLLPLEVFHVCNNLGNHFETPTQHTRQKDEQKCGRKTVEFALLEAYWVTFCPDVCS